MTDLPCPSPSVKWRQWRHYPAGTYSFRNLFELGDSEQPRPDIPEPEDSAPLPPLPIQFDSRYGEWVTPAGFSILAMHHNFVVRDAATRQVVDLAALGDQRADLEQAIGMAFRCQYGGLEPETEAEEQPVDGELPAIDNAEDLLDDEQIKLPPEVIEGVLHRGCKAIIGGASKARKTWILTDLAVAVAAGLPFWKWSTTQGRVLYINFEIPRAFIKSRIAAVAKAREVFDLGDLDVWTLRGFAAPLWKLLPELLERIAGRDYSLIIIDPVYKLLGGRDENSAGDIGEVCAEIERLAVQTGAAVVFGAHYSKGNQAGKVAMDRIGGSGVFARDADSIVTLTSHKADGAFVVDLILRNHPEQAPFVVEWHFPLMKLAENLNTRDLKPVGGRAPEHDPQELLDVLPADGLDNKAWVEAADAEGIPERSFYRLRRELKKAGKILKSKINGKWVPISKE